MFKKRVKLNNKKKLTKNNKFKKYIVKKLLIFVKINSIVNNFNFKLIIQTEFYDALLHDVSTKLDM